MKIEQSTWSPAAGWAQHSGNLAGQPATFVLVFGGRYLLEDPAVFELVKARYPGAHLLLSSTSGEITDTTITEDALAVTAVRLEQTRLVTAATTIAHPADSCRLGAELAQRLAAPDLVHVFVISDGSLANGTELARGFSTHLPPGVLLTGGLAGDGARFEKTVVGLDAPPASGRIAALGFYGTRFRSTFGTSDGWAPFGPERVVTRADGNRLHTLDGHSALALYKQYLGDQAAGLPGTALRFPLSLTPADGSPTVIRTILSIDEPGQAMVFAGDIPDGARVRFMHASHENIIDGAGEAAGKLADGPFDLVICVSCVGRRIVLGQRTEEETELVRDILGAGPAVTGFYSYGELAPVGRETGCRLHNQTMTITAFTET